MRIKQIIVSAIGLAMLLGVLFFPFSQYKNISLDLAAQKQKANQALRLPGTRELTLDAKSLLGNNFTNAFAKEFALAVVTQYPEGPQNITEEMKRALPLTQISQTQAQIILNQIKQEIPKFSLEDIKTSGNTRLEKLSYLGGLQKVWGKHLGQFQNNDLLLLAYLANRQGDATARKTLANYVIGSEQALLELKQVSPPESFAALHLDLMNLVAETRHSALSFLVETNDPIRTSLTAYLYPELGQKYLALNSAFTKKLSDEGLTLSYNSKYNLRNILASITRILAASTAEATSCYCCPCQHLPLPLPVYVAAPNAPGVIVDVYDDAVYQVLHKYFEEELPRSETAKFQLAQTVQGNIMNFITDQTDTLCPEELKYPDTLTCRRGVENWTAVMRDVEDNAKRVFYNDLASIPNEIIGDPLQKQEIIDNLGLIIDRNPVGNLIEEFMRKVYQNEAYHIQAEEGTGIEGGANIHGNKASLAIALKQYFDEYVQKMKDTTKLMAEIGGGWFGKWECIREIVNLETGDARCDPYGGYSYVITPGQMNTVANVILPTLDIEAAMNSTYFNVIKSYTTLAFDEEGVPTAGLITDQAIGQPNESSIGFMMPGSMAPAEVNPTCQIRVQPFEQHVLMMNSSITILTIIVYANNGAVTEIGLDNQAPNIVSLIIDQTQGNNINYGWTGDNPIVATPITPKLAQTEQILAGISPIDIGEDGQIMVTATIENPDNDKFKTNTCQQKISVTVIPDTTCTIAVEPDPLEFTNSSNISKIDWKGSNIKYPQIKQDVKFEVTFDPPINLARLLNTLDLKLTNNIRANNRSFTLSPLRSTSLLNFPHKHKLELNDLGQSTLEGNLTILGMTNSLCSITKEIKSGYRCSTNLCPPATGCSPGAVCPTEVMVTEPYGSGCRTAYCDYSAGLRLDDGSNAYCIDLCPQ